MPAHVAHRPHPNMTLNLSETELSALSAALAYYLDEMPETRVADILRPVADRVETELENVGNG